MVRDQRPILQALLTIILPLLLSPGCTSPSVPPTPAFSLIETTPRPLPSATVEAPMAAGLSESGLQPLATVTPTAGATPTPAPAVSGRVWSAGDPLIPELGNDAIDVLAYDLAVSLDPNRVQLEGDATLIVEALEPIPEIALDFIGFSIEQVSINGYPLAADQIRRTRNKLILTPPLPLEPGWRATVRITYGGTPAQVQSPYNYLSATIGLRYPGDGTVFAMSQPDGARYWFPSNDTVLDKALFRIAVTAPPGNIGIANGRLLDETPVDGGTRYTWEAAERMPPYLAVVAVGPYERVGVSVVDDVEIAHFVLPGFTEAFAADVSAEAIAFFSDLFGPYPYETFGFITVASPNLSLETQPRVLLSTSYLTEATMVHEIAHMWFGNWVTVSSWREMWRNEGFATYFEYLWATRDAPELLDQEIATLEQSVIARGGQVLLGSTGPDALFSFINYHQGAVVVHKLRREMGDDAFFNGLRTYIERFADSAATDAEFRAVMEEAAGRDLDAFWNAWFAPLP